MINGQNFTAVAHWTTGAMPMMRTDTNNVLLRMNREQALAFIAEMTKYFAEEGLQGVTVHVEVSDNPDFIPRTYYEED